MSRTIDSLRPWFASALLPLALVGLAACSSSNGGGSGKEEECEDDGDCETTEPVCGDGVCDEGETDACADCSEDPAVCGNGVCEPGETEACADCSNGPDPVCGNGVCEAGETSACADCSSNDPVCGNGVCEAGETQACGDCAPAETTGTIVVENYSSYAVYYLHIAPCSSSSWGPDLLGSNVLSSGYSVTIEDVPAGCWDLKADTGGSGYWEEYGVQLSVGETFTWSLFN